MPHLPGHPKEEALVKVSWWHRDTLRGSKLGIRRMPPCLQPGDQLTLFGKQGFANPGAVTRSDVLPGADGGSSPGLWELWT